MFRLYNDNQNAMESGDFSLLADTHASSSALKSLCTINAANAIETCRRACGGKQPFRFVLERATTDYTRSWILLGCWLGVSICGLVCSVYNRLIGLADSIALLAAFLRSLGK